MAKRKERDAVVFLNEQLKMAGEVLSEAEMGRMINRLRAYSMESEEADLSQESRLFRSIYGMMKSAQDKAIEKYDQTCERNRQIAARRLGRMVTSGDAPLPSAPGVTNLIESNPIKSNLTGASGDDECLSGHEVKGVPGVVWA